MEQSIYKIIYDIIAKINPYDALEEQHIQVALKWIKSGAEIFRLEKHTASMCFFALENAIDSPILLGNSLPFIYCMAAMTKTIFCM